MDIPISTPSGIRGMDIRVKYARSVVCAAAGQPQEAAELADSAIEDARLLGLTECEADRLVALPEGFKGTPLADAWNLGAQEAVWPEADAEVWGDTPRMR